MRKNAQDRAWFKQHVRGGILVLGRRSFEETNKAIPGVHYTIVVSCQRWREGHASKDVEFVPSFAMALDKAKKMSIRSFQGENSTKSRRMIWIGGGTELYAPALPLASHLVITEVF